MEKSYSMPVLREYGSLMELTEGCTSGFSDFGKGKSSNTGTKGKGKGANDGCGPMMGS